MRYILICLVLLFLTSCEKHALSGFFNSVLPDTTPPAPAVNLKDWISFNSLTDTPMLTWEGGDQDTESGFSHFEISIGVSPGDVGIMNWVNINNTQSINLTGLAFSTGVDYFFNLRSVDNAGNRSTVVSSDGWRVTSVAPAGIAAKQPIATDWNTYYRTLAPTLACDTTTACVHGAEKKILDVPSEASCTNLKIEDYLDVFDWYCDDGSGHAIFYTRNLKIDKGLSDLVNATSWKTNYVAVIKSGVPVYTSTPLAWWGNAVEELPDNSTTTMVTLSDTGKVYTLSGSRGTHGYTLGADGISIVTLGGAELSVASSGTIVACPGSAYCLVYIGQFVSYHWVEGRLRGDGNGIGVVEILIVTFRNEYAVFNKLIIKNASAGMYIDQGKRNWLHNIKIDSVADGVRLRNAESNSIFERVYISNSTNDGFSMTNPSNFTAVSEVMLSGDEGGGVGLVAFGGKSCHINGVTVVGYGAGWAHHFSEDCSFNNIVIANSAPTAGAYLYGGLGDNLYSNFVISNHSIGFQYTLAAPLDKFTNHLLLGNTTNCLFVPAGSYPLQNADCDNDGPSDAVKKLGVDLTNSFVSSTDLRLRATDTQIFNNTEDAATPNDPFVAGATCPSAVNGNQVTTNLAPIALTYLFNAIEISRDEIGNDNSLCETNEACIYAPNFGGYQGEGNFYDAGACLFQNGTVSGVTMYAYPTNGI